MNATEWMAAARRARQKGADEGPRQRPRRVDGRTDGGPRPHDRRPGRADPPAMAAEGTTAWTGTHGADGDAAGRAALDEMLLLL